ncbi:MAG: preprotein translocase subunit SecG [Candidatus Binatia bacterium]
MIVAVTVIHILVSLGLILVVLLQTGKGAEMGAVFGGASSTVFGSSGAGNFLTRLTTAMAVIFMMTSLTLGYFSGKQLSGSIFDSGNPEIQQPANPQASPEGTEQAGSSGKPQASAPVAPQPQKPTAP